MTRADLVLARTDPPYVTYERIPTTGRLIVNLGGRSYNTCSTDIDCPPFAFCYINQSWSAYPQQCACSTFDQLEGESCLSRTATPMGKFYFATQIIVIVLGLTVALSALCTFVVATRRSKEFMRRVTVLNTTLALVLLASLFMATKFIIVLTPFKPHYDADGTLALWSNSTNIALLACFILSVFLTSLAVLNLSLLWLTSLASTTMPRLQRFVRPYKWVLLIYYVGFCVAACYYTYTHVNRLVATALSCLSIVYALFTYLLVWWKLRGFLGKYTDMMQRNEELGCQLRLIAKAAVLVILIGCVLTASLIAFLGGGGTFHRAPRSAPDLVALQIFNMASLPLLATIVWYIWESVRLRAEFDGRRAKFEKDSREERMTSHVTSSRMGGEMTQAGEAIRQLEQQNVEIGGRQTPQQLVVTGRTRTIS